MNIHSQYCPRCGDAFLSNQPEAFCPYCAELYDVQRVYRDIVISDWLGKWTINVVVGIYLFLIVGSLVKVIVGIL